MTLGQYLHNKFPRDLSQLRFEKPNSVILAHTEDFRIDRNTVFFGGSDWRKFNRDINRIHPEDVPYFILCLFTIVIIDQNFFSNFQEHYPAFRKKTMYPKFGWSGFGTHMEKPKKLLSVPEQKGVLNREWMVQHVDEYVNLFIEECQRFFSAQLPEIQTQDFLDALVNDRDFVLKENDRGTVFEVVYGKLLECKA
jgi:hypothetical protein